MALTDRVQVLSRLATTLASLDQARPLTWRIGESARLILGANGAAITLDYTANSRITVAATDDVSERLEDLQEVLGEGPGHDAYNRGHLVTTFLDEPSQAKWPAFTAAAREAFGPLSLCAVPMRPSTNSIGVLTVYKVALERLDAPEESVQFLGDAVGAALLKDPQSQTEVNEAGGGSWASRAPINQAAGMVVAQLGISPEDALAILRAHAFANNVDLLAIATRTIARELDFSTTPPSGG